MNVKLLVLLLFYLVLFEDTKIYKQQNQMQGTGGNWSYNRACTLTLPSHHKPSARSNFGIKKIKNVLSQPLSCECCCITACCFNPSTTPAVQALVGCLLVTLQFVCHICWCNEQLKKCVNNLTVQLFSVHVDEEKENFLV